MLNLIIDALKYLEKSSGDELKKPKVLVVAPTATAAAIVKGKTIESALGISPQNHYNYTKAGTERQSNLKFMYSDLRVVVADEVRLVTDEYLQRHSSLKLHQVSMVGCNKLAKMSYQLQSFADGPDKKSFMGGKAFIG